MLVQRWGILRTAIPHNLSIKKIIAIVNALARLCNFCINELDPFDVIPEPLARDTDNLINNSDGFVDLVVDDNHGEITVPTDLMQAGHHFDNVPCNILWQHQLNHSNLALPRTVLHDFMANGHWERPRTRTATNL
jgi:hypothetical protein